MKILHGMSNVAGQGSYAVKGLKEIGEEARLVIWRDNKFGYECDKSLNIGKKKWLYPWYGIKMIAYGLYAIFKYDYFHFHFGYSVLPFNLDLPLLSVLRKKYVMELHGSDIRWFFYRKKPESWDSFVLPDISENVRKRMKKIFRYTDQIILHDEELRKHLIGYEKCVTYVPLRVDISKFHPQYPEISCRKPVIVHAPTNIEVKGSQYIFDAIEELKKNYEFEFILVQNKTQEEAFKIYQKADIVIDQLRAGTYGVFAIEAMALGKPVLCYISDDMKEHFPEEMPIVNTSIDTVKERVEELLSDSERRHQLGVAGRQYVENYHNYKHIAKLLQEIYYGEYSGGTQLDAFKKVKQIKEIFER